MATRLTPMAWACLAAAGLREGVALAAAGVGTPVGPVEGVPTETLPAGPEEATAGRPGGGGDAALAHAGLFYAYGATLVVDRNGEPILDPKTRRPLTSGFCQLWKEDWAGGTFTFDVGAGREWWTRVTMRVDKRAREINILRVWGPNVLAVPGGGWRPAGPPDEIAYEGASVGIVMSMREAPGPGWPCARETWEAQLRAERRTIVRLPGGDGGGGGDGPGWGGSIGRYVTVCDESGCHQEYRAACRGEFVC